jgi:hypothetical protein
MLANAKKMNMASSMNTVIQMTKYLLLKNPARRLISKRNSENFCYNHLREDLRLCQGKAYGFTPEIINTDAPLG